jgi:hypothetical protein
MPDMMTQASEHARLKDYFGETTKAAVCKKLTARMNDFYNKRNEIVHSLNSVSGYGVDFVFDYIELFECFADGIRAAITRQTVSWSVRVP